MLFDSDMTPKKKQKSPFLAAKASGIWLYKVSFSKKIKKVHHKNSKDSSFLDLDISIYVKSKKKTMKR
jgi:hypothetical protein